MPWSMSVPPPIDVDTMLRRASRRVWIGGSPRQGGSRLNVLSRRTLDRLIQQAVSDVVDRLRAEGARSLAQTEARLATESRQELDLLLRKVQELGASAPEEEIYFPDAEEERPRETFDRALLEPGRGLDFGSTHVTASARSRQSGGPVFNVERNSFLEVRADGVTQAMLRKFGVDCVVRGSRAYLIGDPAYHLATIFDKQVRRPLKETGDSAADPDGALLVRDLLERILGRPRRVGEICVYSVPAEPAESRRNFIYHCGVLENSLRALGYAPRSMIESHAIIQAEFQNSEYSGIGITFGGGRVNVCIACKGLPALTVSTPRGGDWIDENVSNALGVTVARVRSAKELGMHLYRPEDPVQGAVAIYYRHLLQDLFETLQQKIGDIGTLPGASKPLDIVCAGGVAMAGGFVDLFREELRKSPLTLPVGEIRISKDPLQAVAAGCLRAAQEETQAQGENPEVVIPVVLEQSPVVPERSPAVADRSPAAPQPPPVIPEGAGVVPERAPSVAEPSGLRPVPSLRPIRLRP